MAPEIFIIQDGKEKGPFSNADLLLKLKLGTVTGRTLAWFSGLPAWQPLDQVLATNPDSLPANAPTCKPELPTVTVIAPAVPSTVAAQDLQRIIITGVEIPFGKMVNLLLSLAVAAVPALILFCFVVTGITLILALGFGFLEALVNHLVSRL